MNSVLVLIVTLGSLCDMNYLALKKQLVNDTKVPQLVVDAAGGDYSDHDTFGHPKAKDVLNKAERRLEQALVELKTEERRELPLAPGQFSLAVNDLRYVSRIDLEKDGVTYPPLRRKVWSWLRDYFLKPFGLVDRGRPCFWCRDQSMVELLSNPDFATGLTGWTELPNSGNPGAAPTITWLVGRLTITAGNESAFFYANIAETSLSDARVEVDVFSSTPSSLPSVPSFTIQVDNNGGQMNGLVRTYDGSTGVFESGFVADQPVYDRVLIAVFPGATVVFNSVSVKKPLASSSVSVLTLPPSDDDYVAHVYGGYFARAFEDDEDETWFSANASGALLLMARGYVELDVFHNFASFQRFEAQAILEAKEVWHNKVWEQVTSTPREERRIHPISFYDLRT